MSAPVIRVGLGSDLSEFALPSRGTPWTLAAGKTVAVVRGPLTFRAAGGSTLFRIQAGAFSEETTAKSVAEKLSAAYGLPANTIFSAEKGLYLVRIGQWGDAAAAKAGAAKLAADDIDTFVVSESAGTASLFLRDETGREIRLAAPAADVTPPDRATMVEFNGKKYRGALRVLVNSRGALNVINLVNVEEYLRGVVPAEMGPKHFDELEALKAQAVAARTYALDGRGGSDAEGYDLCATPKCQAYGGADAEDPLSDAAVEQTKGLVALAQGKLIHALFSSTCGGSTEDVAAIFPSMTGDYLKSVACGESDSTVLLGAGAGRKGTAAVPLSALEWRGKVFSDMISSRRKPATRQALWKEALSLAGLPLTAAPPASLSPAEVYPAVVSAFGLSGARDLHLTAGLRAYDLGPPDAAAGLRGAARDAYETLLRINFTGSASLAPAGRRLTELEFDGVLFSAAIRLGAVSEIAGHAASRQGGSLVVKTSSGRVSVPADASLHLARRVGDSFLPAESLALRSGDAVRYWKIGERVVALWVDYDPAGATFESGSSWTDWVRRVSGRELAQRMGSRVAGTQVRSIDVTKRGASGRAVEATIVTDKASVTLSGFDLRQALGLPDLLFSVEESSGESGPDFVFIGRGWGHGVGLCQNGAYGMALAGRTYEEILKHYYTGIEIGPLPAAP